MTAEPITGTIYTTYFSSPAGLLRLKGTDEFVTELFFCDETEAAHQANASQEISPVLRQCMQELNEYFEGERKEFTVPVNQPGTTFQQAVWQQLLAIPYGTTISYLELSRRMGNVKAIRAAAASNGKNKIAVIVPCHRVIGSNRAMTGYAGGISRKIWLLQHEATFSNEPQTLFS